MRSLLGTEDSLPLLIARLTLGGVMLPHGLQKTLGLFGGYGFANTMTALTTQAGLPAFLAFLVILSESAGSLCLLFGFLTRVAAFGCASVMAGAIVMVHVHNGFFMNWAGNQKGEGFEYHVLALGLALALLVGGGGSASVDRALASGSR